MPRKTTDIRLAKEIEDGVLRLSPLDLAIMMASQGRADVAERDAQIAFLRRDTLRVQKELEAMRIVERYRQLEDAAAQAIQVAKGALKDAKNAHNELSAGLAKKYNVDWASCAYNLDTGVITPTPKE